MAAIKLYARCVVLGVLIVCALGSAPEGKADDSFPLGDPRACRKVNTKTETFEVLPGVGWDNLRNVDAGLLVVYNYSRCKTTEDGRFLIPDSVNTIPLKESKVNIFAELISHWSNYTSTTSRSVNVDVGLTFDSNSISGKFSDGFESVKSKQIGDRTYTTRVQLRYVRYTAKLQPDTPLHPTFKSRLLVIAGNIELNKTDRARYESELLVRDFGTHVITSLDAGAALVQTDEINSAYVQKRSMSKNTVTASASASLFGFLKFGTSYTSGSSKSDIETYMKERMSSQIATLGGPLFQAVNFTANDWTDEVDKNLVAVDRSGDPIFFLISSATLPELPAGVLSDLYTMIEKAVKLYYEFNTYRGCTKLDSPNFSPAANLDDGTCESPYTNLTFGGVFQTCRADPGSNNGDICASEQLSQVNPKTGDFSCPNEYEKVKLHTGSLSSSRPIRSCHSCWLFFKCCHSSVLHSRASYTMYWCAAKGPVSQDSGYLFGGLFTSKVSNPLTQGQNCPVNFYPRKLGTDMYVCISDDYELGMKYSMPFGGFMSCKTGNPLAVESTKHSTGKLKSGGKTLLSFYQASGNWPKHCPKGFSQHLAYVDQGCEINYCLKAGSLSGIGLPKVRRPPFQSAPLLVPADDNYVMFDPATNEWKKNYDAMQFIKDQGWNEPNQFSDPNNTNNMSAGAAAGISIAATLACVALTTIIIVVIRRRRKSEVRYRRLEDPILSSQSNYGTNDSGTVQVDVEN